MIRLVLPLTVLLEVCVSGCRQQTKGSPQPEEEEEECEENQEGCENETSPTVTEMIVDATSSDPMVWKYLDFEGNALLNGDELGDGLAWDLGFQRTRIKSNGGVSGSGDVLVARLEMAFDDVSEAPSSVYLRDLADSDDMDSYPDFAFSQAGGWYDYNPMTHQVTPKALTYVVRTQAMNFYKIAITSYYDASNTPAMIGIKWVMIPGPSSLPNDEGGEP